MVTLKVGTRRTGSQSTGYRYIGVLRAGGQIVIECGHEHANRDFSTQTNGQAASVCARMILQGARNAATAEHTERRYRTAWTKLMDGTGFAVPKDLITSAERRSKENADAYLSLVERTRVLLNGDTTAGAQ